MHRSKERRWQSRPVLAFALNAGVFVVPLCFAVLVAGAAVQLLPHPDTRASLFVWWILVIGSTILALYIFDRLARRLLPLAALMKMTMLFPDHAPSRMELAKKAGRTRDLSLLISRASLDGKGEAQETAEQILTLLSALTEHDRATRGHSEKVRVLVDMISQELKLTEFQRDRLRWAALLHDVGKLAVPKELLNKPGNPDQAEWDLIRRHPSEGRRIVAPLAPFLGEWVGAIEHHHEKWDGTGYSLGLAGEEISLGGRIVAVADAYEVITGTRPYKKPLGVRAAREELARQAGTHFDPHIVRALFNVSIGRLWRAIGFSSWVATLPFLPTWLIPRLPDTVRNLGGAAAGVLTAIALGGGLVAGQAMVTSPEVRLRPPATPQASMHSPQPTEVLGVQVDRTEVLGGPGSGAPGAPTSPVVAQPPPQQLVAQPPPPPSSPPAPAPTLAKRDAKATSHGRCVSDTARSTAGQKGSQVRPVAKGNAC